MLYKHYGGIEKFKRTSFLFANCLDNAVKKETELPKLINEIIKELSGKDSFIPQFNPPKKMRSAEEILKDYGLGGVKIG